MEYALTLSHPDHRATLSGVTLAQAEAVAEALELAAADYLIDEHQPGSLAAIGAFAATIREGVAGVAKAGQ